MKKKLLVVIPGKRYVNHYLRTNALEEVKLRFDVSFLILEGLKLPENFYLSNEVKYFAFNGDLREKYSKIFGLLAWKSIDRSKSFRFRILRGKPVRESRLIVKALGKNIETISRVFANFILKFYIYLRLAWHSKTLWSNKEILREVKRINPSIVLCPNNAHDPIGSDLVRTCKRLKIPTLFLIDNWDNLSSKSLLWPKPDYLTVWGEQSVNHGIEIQEISRDKIFPIGTPRYDKYFELRDSKLNSKFNFRYILFVGTYLKFDEISVLIQLDKIITNNHIFKDVKIIYRPHPEQDRTSELEKLNLDKVLIDPNIGLTEENVNGVILPISSTYFPSLISNAEFVMGGLTSMLIEATIFYKKFLALVHDDGHKFFSPKSIYENYTHFEGIDNLPNLMFCSDLDELESVLIDTWISRNSVNFKEIDQARNHFYYADDASYASRLFEVVAKIVR